MATLQEVEAKMTFTPKEITGWSDFKQQLDKPPQAHTDPETDAYTSADFSWSSPSKQYDDGLYRFSGSNLVTVKLDQTLSFVLKTTISGSQSSAILNHEKGHYNVAKLAGRELCLELMNLSNADPQELTKQADKIYSDKLAKATQVEDTYDDDQNGTDHGNDANAQARWDGKIANGLKDVNIKISTLIP
jgi:hypothetical protein